MGQNDPPVLPIVSIWFYFGSLRYKIGTDTKPCRENGAGAETGAEIFAETSCRNRRAKMKNDAFAEIRAETEELQRQLIYRSLII